MFQKLKTLSVNLTVYGMGDVAVQIASLLLLPLYVRVLTPTDYGAIFVLLIVEQILRVVYRWGIDASFMRFYYDCADARARQVLASTVFFFLVAVSGSVVLIGVAAAPFLSRYLFDSAAYAVPLQLVFVSTFLGSVSFLPFHVLRIEGRARTFVALTFTANVSTLAVKLLFVAGLRWGVVGLFVADLVVAVGIALLLLPRFAALIRPVFSRAVLAECLRFGLPRLPHGAAHQVIAGADRYFLNRFLPLGVVGVYGIGAGFGLGLKLFLSAFETAWAPFYFAEMRQPDARDTYRAVTTYGVAVLVLLASGLAAIATDIVRLMTTPQYYGAAEIVPWIGLSVVLQGVYLLTSIGLNITKKTMYYPVVTGVGAAASVVFNLLLIPRFGMIGAAWSNSLAYGALALTGYALSQKWYPMTYEWGRLARIVAAGGLALAVGRLVLPPTVVPLVGVLVRGTAAVLVFLLVLVATGFLDDRERSRLRQIAGALMARRRSRHLGEPAPQPEGTGAIEPDEDMEADGDQR